MLSFRDVETGLRIGDRNVIREGVTIHRSTREGGATVVGSDCFLMACVHVAHDNRIGDRVILANNVMLAGHVAVGERAFVGGGADRIRAPQVVGAVDMPQRQVLPGLEAERIAQIGRHVEGDDHGVAGVGAHLAHAQGMEVKTAHRGLVRRV